MFGFILIAAALGAADPLADGWKSPPDDARPYTWYHWMNGNVTKEGITADLEAMRAVGLGGVQVFDAGLPLPAGPVRFASEAWYEHLRFAAEEAERLGLSFGIANCSGWTSSGGPWITPEYAMKTVVHTAVRFDGGRRIRYELPRTDEDNGFYRDIAVLAFPTMRKEVRIDDLEHRIFRLRGSENGPVDVEPMGPADNPWRKPLVTAIPAWTFETGGSPSGRKAFATCKLWTADDSLLPSGLLGPVTVGFVREEPLASRRE